MHFETTGLPADTREVFFSDQLYYACTVARRSNGKPASVGCGRTKAEAIADMRQLRATKPGAAYHTKAEAQSAPTPQPVDDFFGLDEAARHRLGLQFRALRLAAGLSQLQVAKGALGFTKSHAAVSRLERGVQLQVDAEVFAKLMDFFQQKGA